MNLYELSNAARELTEMLSDGEIDDTVYHDTLESMGCEAIESTVKAIRNLESDLNGIASEINFLEVKKSAVSAKIERLKKALLDYLTLTNQPKICTGLFTVRQGKAVSADIPDSSLIPEKYYVPQPPKIDRKAILTELKNGAEISGARLKTKGYIVIK